MLLHTIVDFEGDDYLVKAKPKFWRREKERLDATLNTRLL